MATPSVVPAAISFADPDSFRETSDPKAVAAKRTIADYLNVPLAKLSAKAMDKFDAALADSLRKADTTMALHATSQDFNPLPERIIGLCDTIAARADRNRRNTASPA